MSHNTQLHKNVSEGAVLHSPTLSESFIFQHLNPAKAIGEIKMLLTGMSKKPPAVAEPMEKVKAAQAH
jgi:hypothetical protein